MQYLKTNLPRFLLIAKDAAIVLLQCTGIFALFALTGLIFTIQGNWVFP